MSDGWTESAGAWIADLGDEGDFSRRFVLDTPMMAAVRTHRPARALDVGCGEGRFCRMMQAEGVSAVGVDPTDALIDQARARDPSGDYRIGRAEALAFEDGAFDLVVSYLSLIDIPDIRAAIPEMARVLRPGGVLLIANLNSFNTAGLGLGWIRTADGRDAYAFDDYLRERAEWAEWRGIRIRNWHRPLSLYMDLLLGQGLTMTHFTEPEPIASADPWQAQRYRRAPWHLTMQWRKPEVETA